MNSQEFIADALRTESKPETLHFNRGGLVMLLTAAVQMATVLDTAKKTMFYGKALDEGKFRDQIEALEGVLQRLKQRQGIGFADDTPSGTGGLHQPNMRIAHGAIGMYGEAGELVAAVLKQVQTGEIDLINAGEELGDSFWYAAIISDETGMSFEAVQETVIKKLKARYGDKFTQEAALNRDLEQERAVLESELAPSGN